MNLNFITKKTFLIFSLFVTTLFLLFIFLGTNSCYRNEFCNIFRNSILSDDLFFTIIFPIFLAISLITYPLHKNIFTRWKRFAIWATPVVVTLSIIIANIDTGGGIGGLIEGQMVLFTLFALHILYFITSLAVIALAWWKERSSSKSTQNQ